MFSSKLSLETKDIQLPLHSDDISTVSNGITQADTPVTTAMNYTSSSVNGDRVISKSRKHGIVVLTSFAVCQGGRPSNALRVDIIRNHTH